MATKKTRATGLDRERIRRRKLEQAKVEDLRGRKPGDGEPQNADDLTTGGTSKTSPRLQDGVVASGARQPGQQVTCVWCGESLSVKARGPLPKYCSSTCRHRAWEQERAARTGRAAVVVVDRAVVSYPSDTDGWVRHLDRLAHEIRAGQLDVDLLTSALDNVSAAVEGREPRRRAGMWTSATLSPW